MNKQNSIGDNYDLWKAVVNSYVYKIIRTRTDDIPIDLKRLYKKNYHPYTAAVLVILKSNEYKTNKIYNSFVIPYESKLIIVELN